MNVTLKVKQFIANLKTSFLRSLADVLYKNAAIDQKKILIDNFIGKGFGDNPKYIYNSLIKIRSDIKVVWLVRDYDIKLPEGITPVKYNTLKAYKEFYSAHIWIDNVRNAIKPTRKRPEQVYIQTWHGFLPFKHIENQIACIEKNDPSYVKMAKLDGRWSNIVLSSNSALTEIMENHFWLDDSSKILKCGSPESDIYFDSNASLLAKQTIKRHYSIPDDFQIVLYMPTFRDGADSSFFNIDYEKILSAVDAKLGSNSVLLLRMHPNIKFDSRIYCGDRIKDASNYPDANELLCAMDWLISDYSSVVYVPIILNKPVILYVPDLDIYRRSRGLNECFDALPCPMVNSIDSLAEIIKGFNYEEYKEKCQLYCKTVTPYNIGKASEYISSIIADLID